MNVNFLGEAILGEDEAQHAAADEPAGPADAGDRGDLGQDLHALLADLRAGPRAHRAASCATGWSCSIAPPRASRFTRPDGTRVPKFVYLDMEEYRDLHLTAEAFMRTLDRPGLEAISAGIVLQAYIPDSFAHAASASTPGPAGGSRPEARRSPFAWSKARTWRWSGSRPRCAAGRRRRTRPSAETDANYKRMVQEGDEAGEPRRRAPRRGSHNLFDVATRSSLAAEANALRSRPVRDARRHGQSPAPRAVGAHAQPAALRAGLPQGGLPQRHRLPDPPPGREHRPGELPAPRLQAQRRRARSGSGWTKASASRSGSSPRSADAPRRTQNRRHRARRACRRRRCAGTTSSTSRTPTSRCRRTATGRRTSSPVGTALRVRGDRDRRWSSTASRSSTGAACASASILRGPAWSSAAIAQATSDDIERAVACAKADRDGWRALGVDGRSELLGPRRAGTAARRGAT